MSPVVVVDDVSPVVRTGDVDRIRYRGSGVVSVPKTQNPVLFVCWVGHVDGVSKESVDVSIADFYKGTDTCGFSTELWITENVCKWAFILASLIRHPRRYMAGLQSTLCKTTKQQNDINLNWD